MIRIVNEIISCFYYRDKQGMKYSSESTVLFIAKCKLVIPVFIWGMALIAFLERYILKTNYLTNLPAGRLLAAILVILIYFPLNRITWKLNAVKEFIDDEENSHIIKQRYIHFFIIVGLGMFLLFYIGYQNKWHPVTP